MNRIVLEDENVITIDENLELVVQEGVCAQVYLYGEEGDYHLSYYLEKNSKLEVFHYAVNTNFHVEIHLQGQSAEVDYFFSTINQQVKAFQCFIFHEAQNTVSKLVSHGVNKNGTLVFDVNPKVYQKQDGCICNQENSIINLGAAQSTIQPNLLIDHYDIVSNHSAYIGQFKEEELFYFMSRGISRKLSEEILMKYFLVPNRDEALKKVPKFLDHLEKL